jgi:hypothetical protein
MSARKDALMESLISHLEVRGELCQEGNAATERAIAAIERELREEAEYNRFTLWITGYRINRALSVERVSATDKAVKFSIPGTKNKEGNEYTFFMPKKALVADKNESSIVNVARWFTVEGYLSFLFDRFGSVYNR